MKTTENVKKYGLKGIVFINSAHFEYVNLDISKSTLLLGHSGVGKTSIMRAVLFFYTMDYSAYMLGTGGEESKKEFTQWYFEQKGASHIAYTYETSNGKFLFIVSKHGKLKYTFVDITDFEGNIEDILMNEDNIPVLAEQLDTHLLSLNLNFYTTTKTENYKRIFIKDEYSKLGNKFIETQLNNIKYYLYKTLPDTKIYGKYLSKIFLNSRVSEASIKEIFTSLVSVNSDEEEITSSSSIAIDDISRRIERIQFYQNDYNRFKSRLKQIEKAGELKTLHSNKKEELKEIKEKLALYLANKTEIKNYFKDKTVAAENEYKMLQAQKKETEAKFTKQIEDKGADIKYLEKSIKDIEKLKKHYKNINIDLMIKESEKEEYYKNELNTLKQTYSLLTNKQKDMKNTAKEEELKVKNDIFNKYSLLNENLQKKIIECDKNIENLLNSQKEKEKALSLYKEKADKLKEELHNKNLEAVSLLNKIKLLEQQEIINDEINLILSEIKIQKDMQNDKLKIKEALVKNIKKVEDERIQISENYSIKKEKIENEYNQKFLKIKNETDELKRKKANLLDENKNTLFQKLTLNNSPYRNIILNIVKDDILYSEDIEIIKKDNSDTLYGYEISMPLKSYENILAQITQAIKEKNIEYSTLKGAREREIQSLDNSTRAEQKKKRDTLNGLIKEQETNNSILSNIQNKLNMLENKLNIEKNKAVEVRNSKILKMKTDLESVEKEKILLKHSIEDNEDMLKNKISEIEKEFAPKIAFYKEEKEKIKNQQKELNRKKTVEEKESIKKIWDKYNEILSADGVDIKQIESIQDNINKTEKLLNKINSDKQTVFNYLNTDLPKINGYEELKNDLAKTKSFKKELENKRDTQIKILTDESDKCRFAFKNAKKTEKEVSEYLERIDEFTDTLKLNEMSVDNKYFSKSEIEFIDANIEEFKNKISNAEKINFEISQLEEELKKKIINITKGFYRDNALNLPIVDDSVITFFDYMQVLKVYISRMNKKSYEYGQNESLKLTVDTIAYLKNSLDNMKLKIEQIDNLKNEVNRKIAESIKHIDVIDFLKIVLNTDNTNPVIEMIDDIIQYTEKYSHIYINGFVQDKDKEIYENVNKKITKLKNEIDVYRKNNISINDLFSISFRISENGSDIGTITSLNDVGSNGTGIMVRSIIYISLLHNNSIKIKTDENQVFHCIIDEISNISENYLEQLLNFVESKGFSFLNATPVISEEMIALYPNVYTGYMENGKSFMVNTAKEYIDVNNI